LNGAEDSHGFGVFAAFIVPTGDGGEMAWSAAAPRRWAYPDRRDQRSGKPAKGERVGQVPGPEQRDCRGCACRDLVPGCNTSW